MNYKSKCCGANVCTVNINHSTEYYICNKCDIRCDVVKELQDEWHISEGDNGGFSGNEKLYNKKMIDEILNRFVHEFSVTRPFDFRKVDSNRKANMIELWVEANLK